MATYHVDTDHVSADDANPGTNPALPLETIQRGIDLATSPGDVVSIVEGLYREQLELKSSGTAQSPIIIQSHPDNTSLVDVRTSKIMETGGWVYTGANSIYYYAYASDYKDYHPGAIYQDGVLLYGHDTVGALDSASGFFTDTDTSRVYARGLSDEDLTAGELMERAYYQASVWTGSGHTSITYINILGPNLRFQHSNSRGIYIVGATTSYWTVRDVEVAWFGRVDGPGAEYGISIFGIGNNIIERCHVHHGNPNSELIHIGTNEGADPDNCIVSDCLLTYAQRVAAGWDNDYWDGYQSSGIILRSSDNIIERNRIYKTCQGILIEGEDTGAEPASTPTGNIVRYNFIYDLDVGNGINISGSYADSADNEILTNTVDTAGAYGIGMGDEMTGLLVYNNIFKEGTTNAGKIENVDDFENVKIKGNQFLDGAAFSTENPTGHSGFEISDNRIYMPGEWAWVYIPAPGSGSITEQEIIDGDLITETGRWQDTDLEMGVWITYAEGELGSGAVDVSINAPEDLKYILRISETDPTPVSGGTDQTGSNVGIGYEQDWIDGPYHTTTWEGTIPEGDTIVVEVPYTGDGTDVTGYIQAILYDDSGARVYQFSNILPIKGQFTFPEVAVPSDSGGYIPKPPSPVLNPAHPLSQSLVGAWLFTERSGIQVSDLSSFKNHGTLRTGNGGLPEWTGSHWGAAIDFDSQGYITAPGKSEYMDAELTVIARFKINTLPSVAGRDNYLTYLPHSESPWASWVLYIDSASDKVTLTTRSTVPTTEVVQSDDAIEIDKWYHVAITVDRNFTSTMYIDAVAQADTETNDAGLFQADGDLQISNSGSVQFDGIISYLKIYNRALSRNEFAQLFHNSWQGLCA